MKLSAETGDRLQRAAYQLIEASDFATARSLLELRLTLPAVTLQIFAAYALCLGKLGRADDAHRVAEQAKAALAGLPDSPRKRQLELALSVALQVGTTPQTLPSPSHDALFSGR